MKYNTMEECFGNLNENIFYSIENTDLDEFFATLDKIDGPTIVTGVGGSSVVATFLAKILREKKHIIATFMSPRDLEYMDLGSYQNVVSCSYSGGNVGVTASFNNNLNHYLLTGHPKDFAENIVYNMKEEMSYVSISATMVPLSLLFLYYTDNNLDLLKEILDSDIDTPSKKDIYEVIYGYESQTAATMLDSCFIESGIAACALHDKYNYCHGRINLSRKKMSGVIYFRSNNELDEVITDTIPKLYDEITTIDCRYDDTVINDFYLTLISLKFIHAVALNNGVDVSDMKELLINDVFYLFKGKMK